MCIPEKEKNGKVEADTTDLNESVSLCATQPVLSTRPNRNNRQTLSHSRVFSNHEMPGDKYLTGPFTISGRPKRDIG